MVIITYTEEVARIKSIGTIAEANEIYFTTFCIIYISMIYDLTFFF